MRRSLYLKLTLAFMLVAFLTAGLVAVFIRVTSADRLTQLIIDQQRDNLEQILASYYKTNGSWTGIEQNWLILQSRNEPTPQANATPFPPPPDNSQPADRRFFRDRRSLFGLAGADGRVIVSVEQNYPVGGQLPADKLSTGTPVLVDGVRVGTIIIAPRQPNLNPAESLFLQRTTQALLFAMLGALLVALTLGILLARTLTRPVQALTRAAQRIADGELEQQVQVNSRDEIGQLAAAFNRMSQEVARVNQLRRQMTADIAHDLRTPLTVIAGYIEAMRDGILQPTPQRMSLIYAEIERLQSLVSDLSMLSQADAGELPLNPQQVSPRHILEHSAELFRHHAEQQEVHLALETDGSTAKINVDESRILQVMDNLISNALRYTPAGGKITLGARELKGKVDITVKDTGEGIPEEELTYIFNRFHRVEKSRHSENGESGLGLSIVKALVEAHKGRVWAESKPGEGSTFHCEFPVS